MKIINFKIIAYFLIWIALGILLIFFYSYRTNLSFLYHRMMSELIPGYALTEKTNLLIFSKSNNNHFYIFAEIKNKRIKFLVDTGATDIIIAPKDAKKINIHKKNLRFTKKYYTANGTVFGAHHNLHEMKIGNLTFKNIKVSINQSPMNISLLGMSFLERFKSYEIKGNRLILRY